MTTCAVSLKVVSSTIILTNPVSCYFIIVYFLKKIQISDLHVAGEILIDLGFFSLYLTDILRLCEFSHFLTFSVEGTKPILYN
jgi:hypothetical protein